VASETSAGSGGGGAGGGWASKMFLGVAVALGVLATVLAFGFIQSSAEGAGGNGVKIVVASRDLSPNAAIDPDRDLKQVDIPARFKSLADRGLDWDGRKNYKGERVNRDIKAGQPVMLADIAGVGQLVLEKPYFALTVPAETSMIIPGDFVKIIITRVNAPAAARGGTATGPGGESLPFDAVVIGKDPGYKVLAVGGYLSKTRQQVMTGEQYGSSASAAKSVTLEVTEPQAKEIMSALGSTGSSGQRANLLLCPSTNTAGATTQP